MALLPIYACCVSKQAFGRALYRDRHSLWHCERNGLFIELYVDQGSGKTETLRGSYTGFDPKLSPNISKYHSIRHAFPPTV